MSVQSGLRKTIQATWIDVGLTPAANIYDNSTGTPSLVAAIPMTEIEDGIYMCSFLPLLGRSYLVTKRVFTDNTYATPDINYAPSSEDFDCVDVYLSSAESGILEDAEFEEELLIGEDC